MSYSDYSITIPNTTGKTEVYTTCPKCSHTRKKKTDKCLSVNLQKETWFCHHCGWTGFLKTEKMEKKTYVLPVWKNNTNLSDKVVKWFASRGINQQTLNDWKITEGMEFMPQKGKEVNTIQFNYFDENQTLSNVKYRTADKCFKLHKGSQLLFYGLNRFSFKDTAFICEGEIDALSLYFCGFKNVLSVPNGANLKTNNLEYFDEVAEKFNECPEVILCLDNDTAGRVLRDQISERIGKEKCKYVEFKQYKDANDCLVNDGVQSVIDSIKAAKEFPLEGVFTIADYENEINDLYINGLDNGLEIGHIKFDRLLRFVKGYITTITGIPGHGKSDFLDEIILRMFFRHGWKTAYYSPENRPVQLHISKLARKIIGKSFQGQNKMTSEELISVLNHLNKNIWFIKPEKDFTLQSILNHARQLKLRFGIDAFVIDAWNKLEHKYTNSETKYIGESLDQLGNFCEANNMHCFLVAHPTKIPKDKSTGKPEVPTLYNISGSANFYNKTDNGITVYRDWDENKSTVYVQKVKFSHWGQIGQSEFTYMKDSGRYIELSGAYSSESWIKNESVNKSGIEPNNDFLNPFETPDPF